MNIDFLELLKSFDKKSFQKLNNYNKMIKSMKDTQEVDLNKIKWTFVDKLSFLFHKKKLARFNFIYGGRGGGKSETIAQAIIKLSFEYKDCQFACLRFTEISIADSVKATLESYIDSFELFNYFNITRNMIHNKKTGVIIIFKGLYTDKKIISFKSTKNVKLVFIEEAQIVTENGLRIVIDTCNRSSDSKFIFAYNRLTSNDSVHDLALYYQKAIKENEKITTNLVYINYYDNIFLNKEMIYEAEVMKSLHYDLYRHTWLGEPRSIIGILFKQKWFQYYTDLNIKFEKTFITVDTAMKTGVANDYSVFAYWGYYKKSLYLIDLVRDKFEYPELLKNFKDFYMKCRKPIVYIEDAVSGTSLIQSLKRENIKNINSLKRTKDKYTRALEIIKYVSIGNVFLNKNADYLKDFLEEICSFNVDFTHRYDDQVDNLIDACKIVLDIKKIDIKSIEYSI